MFDTLYGLFTIFVYDTTPYYTCLTNANTTAVNSFTTAQTTYNNC